MAEKIAAAYLRSSAATTSNPHNDSREGQEAAVRRICGDDVTLYIDWGRSGDGRKTDKRPEYLRLKQDIEAGRIRSVCAYSLSRLGRSTRELATFMDLCQDHGVAVKTATESFDTSSAFGRAIFQIAAVFAELELEIGKERSADARLARHARHEEAGALMPGGRLPNRRAQYGFVHVRDGGVIRREHDPEHPIEPLWQAYVESGQNMLRAGKLLGERGIAAPDGGTWSDATLRRILRGHQHCNVEDHSVIVLPDRSPSGKVRRGGGKPALFRQLVRCFCGSTMTPNTVDKNYYCHTGRMKGASSPHGTYSVPERRLKDLLWPEAGRQYLAGPGPLLTAKRNEEAIAALLAQRERVGQAFTMGLTSAANAERERDEINARLEKLEREQSAWSGMFGDDTPRIDFNDPDVEAQNALLRRFWVRVDLEKGYRAAHVVWVTDPDELRRREEAAIEAENSPEGRAQAEREYDEWMTSKYGTPDQHPLNATGRSAAKVARST